MSHAILTWLGGRDTGASSKALALAAARGLEKLKAEGGPHWTALAARWDELTASYKPELNGSGAMPLTYTLMKEILRPTERRDPRHVDLGNGASVRFRV